jgi:1,4-alpha-glucan branching enzyme
MAVERVEVRDASEQEAFDALARGEHGDPFSLLGMFQGPDGLFVRTFQPDASRVWALTQGGAATELAREHSAGLFGGRVPGRQRAAYRLRVEAADGVHEVDDPWRFPLMLGQLDVHLLAEGNHLRLYEVLGAHPMELDGVAGVGFAVWAPNAKRVSVVGAFNAWDGRRHPMRRRVECGVWELFVPGLAPGAIYKFEIKGPWGELLPLKADPLAFFAEAPPRTASVVHGAPNRSWSDGAWMAMRERADARDAPISIYECHLGSWRRGEGDRKLRYAELADELVGYVKDMGFTHLELMPVTEHPFEGSWGYQTVSQFAPTARHGSPEDFAAFVERCHEAGVGLILDWVPGHFPSDAHGLARFDGTPLYEHADPRQGFQRDWNTLIYNFGRQEVSNFLLASALFWLDRFHVDGLRVDAVASMLYLDYSRNAGEWIPNRFGGRENLEAVDFLKRMNELVFGGRPGATTIAEESTAWPGVSRPTYLGGLGFGFKWNMGWMHDTLRYMSKDPVHRRFHHHDLTFGLLYAFSENFVLPLSHDEVVHGKGSLLGKMPGDRWRKFANLRAYYGFMWTHPGKKLLFMGGEFGQEREWSHDRSLDWHLLADPAHAGLQALVRDLNGLYRGTPALHRCDCEPRGFEWIEASDTDNSVLAFLRRGDGADGDVAVVCNFTPIVRDNYRLGVPQGGWWRERLNTDAACYGGSNVGNGGGAMAEDEPWHGRPHSLRLTLPPLATVVFERAAG